MNLSLRTALLFSAALSIVSVEGVSLARTSGPTLSEELQAEGAIRSTASAAVVKVDIASDLSEARLHSAKVCHISRHPRDGIPASVHACPLAVASADEAAPAAQSN